MTENNIVQYSKIEQLDSLIASSLDVIFRISPTGKINFISPSSLNLLGYEPDEMIDRSISDFIPVEKIKRYFEEISQLFRISNIITFSADLIHKNGARIPVEITGKVVEINGKKWGRVLYAILVKELKHSVNF